MRHADFPFYLLGFERTGRAIAAATFGPDRYLKGTARPQVAEFPAAWKAYPGQYRAGSRSFRVILRNGRLFVVDRGLETPLVATTGGRLLLRDEEAGTELSFDPIIDGEAQRPILGDMEYFRTFRRDRFSETVGR